MDIHLVRVHVVGGLDLSERPLQYGQIHIYGAAAFIDFIVIRAFACVVDFNQRMIEDMLSDCQEVRYSSSYEG